MNSSKADFKASVAQLVLESGEVGSEHPGLEDWIAYRNGALSEARQERLQEHLVSCGVCVELLLDLSSFLGGESAQVSEFERAAFRRALKEAIRRLPEPEEEAPRRPAASPAGRRFSAGGWQTPWPVAALFAAVLASVSIWGGVQHRAVVEMSKPQVNAAVVALSGAASRSGAEAADVVPAAAHSFLLTWYVGLEAHPDYAIEIADETGRTVWAGHGFVKTELGNLHLGLSRRLLAPGVYTIRVFGLDSSGHRGDMMGERTLEILQPADAKP